MAGVTVPGRRGFIRQTFADRFWAKVDRPLRPDGTLNHEACWDWRSDSRGGTQGETGQIRLPAPSRQRITAPRAALLVAEGIADEALAFCNAVMRAYDAAHVTCDRPMCCNPSHLAWQTHAENIQDFIRKFQRFGPGCKTRKVRRGEVAAPPAD